MKLEEKLKVLGEGLYYCGWFKGWIEIERIDGGYSVMWCSGKTTHNPLVGPSVSVDYMDNGEIGMVFKTNLMLWEVRDENKKQYFIKWLSEKIKQAYKKNNK